MRIRFLHEYWKVATLKEVLLSIEQSAGHGPVIRIKTGPGQETEFNTDSKEFQEYYESLIARLAELDPTITTTASQRPGRTTPIFC